MGFLRCAEVVWRIEPRAGSLDRVSAPHAAARTARVHPDRVFFIVLDDVDIAVLFRTAAVRAHDFGGELDPFFDRQA